MKVSLRGDYLEGRKAVVSIWEMHLRPEFGASTRLGRLVVQRDGQMIMQRYAFPHYTTMADHVTVPNAEVTP